MAMCSCGPAPYSASLVVYGTAIMRRSLLGQTYGPRMAAAADPSLGCSCGVSTVGLACLMRDQGTFLSCASGVGSAEACDPDLESHHTVILLCNSQCRVAALWYRCHTIKTQNLHGPGRGLGTQHFARALTARHVVNNAGC